MRDLTKVIDLVKRFEGLRLTSYPDRSDPKKAIWTIGYGTTRGIGPGMTISRETATEYLKRDVAAAAAVVENLVTVPLKDNEFAAVVSLVYNIGANNFRTSSLLKELNEGKFLSAAFEFSRWIFINGKPSPGLINRRLVEHNLFIGEHYV